MLSDGYVKYEAAEVYRSTIMQDFQDEKKKWPTGGHFGFYNCEICHGLAYPCVRRYILFYIHDPAILHLFGVK